MKKTHPEAGSRTAKPIDTRRTDGTAYLAPSQIAARWGWHVESVRRLIRQRRVSSVVLSRRRLVPVGEVERLEAEGYVAHLN